MDDLSPESFEELGPHDHACHLYMDAEDRLSVLVPYFRTGLSRGEKCLLLCGEADAEEILNGLRGKGIDVGSALSRGALLVTQEPVARPGKGGVDPAALVAFFRSSARVAGSEKYAGLRLCADVSFALGKSAPRERLVQYQRLLHDFLAEQKALCLCLHGMNDFPAEFLLDALRAHPTVIYGGIVAKNFYFIPPTGDTREVEASRLLDRRLENVLEQHWRMTRLRRQATRLTRLRDIAASLLADASVTDLLARIVEGVVSLGYRMCWIGMARQDGSVDPLASFGDKEGYLQQTTVRWDDSPLGNGPTGVAIRKGKPDIIRDASRSHRFAPWREAAAAAGYLSAASIPIREGTKVIGALTAHAAAHNAFDREAIEELSSFVLHASLALQRTREHRRVTLSEERFRKLFEQIPAACFTFGRQGNILHWNRHCRRIFGYAREAAEGKSVIELAAYPGNEAKARDIVSRVFQGESFFNLEWEIRTSAGDIRWVLTNAYPYHGKGSDVEMGISVNVDVTGQIGYRRALADSEARYRAAVEVTNVVVVEIDEEGKIVLFNKGAEQITGYRAGEAIGKPFLFFFPEREKERAAEALREVRDGRDAEGFVTAVLARSDAERMVMWNATAARAAVGTVQCVIAFGVDITERLRLEREKEELLKNLANTQKMEAIGAIAGGIAHEYNNILGAILGYTSLLQSRMGADDPDLPAIRKIQESADRAADLTKKLVGFARRGKHQVRPLSLNVLVESALPLLAKYFNPSVEIRSLPDPSNPAVDGDEGQLQRSLLDLCFNARDAMPGGGTLTIRTGVGALSGEEAARYRLKQGEDYAFLEVRDTGTGMTEEVQHRIFEPFFTTKKGNGHSGMGLPSVYGIVKNHNGGIHVESTPGEGSVFRIYLPAAALGEIEGVKFPGEPLPRGTETILIVDDEPEIREVGCELLSALGYRPIAAEDGEDACRVFREKGGEIRLVLLDIVMPKMGGRETFRELRKMAPGLPVLLSSGYSVEGLAREILDEGANGFLHKPYGLPELARTIRRILDEGWPELPFQTGTGA
ncbi:MAG: PAS domain S-box protein [Deltaproteobacteria bacterium]|nr:PAS domain S-box protein [Deltaproteobacteria bacterium]